VVQGARDVPRRHDETRTIDGYIQRYSSCLSISLDTYSSTDASAEGWGNAHEYVTAYASTIQDAIAHRRTSLEWRFVPQMNSTVESYVRCFTHLKGWHTIAFQFDIEQNTGTDQSMLWIIQNTFLNRDSDNYFVRIDEVFSPDSWRPEPKSNRSTLFVNRHAPQDIQSDVIERRIHEDVCPLRPSNHERLARPQTWTPCRRKWEVEKIWV